MPPKSLAKLKKTPEKAPAGRGLAAKAARPPLVRMMRIHDALTAEKYPNCSSMARDLEVTTKTIQRDIEFMRDQLALPIEYEPVERGYYYAASVAQFPMVTVSQGELVALLVAQKAVEQYKGTPFERPLNAAFDKLVSSLGEEENISLHELSEAVSFRTTGVPHGQIATFEVLADAVMKHQRVEFDYISMTAKTSERRSVEPYHLPCIGNQWYLIGFDRNRNGIRTFALPRIQGARNLGKTFEKPEDFSVADMLEGSFSAFQAGKTEMVRLSFTQAVARLVEERQWHKSQKIRTMPGGKLELSMKVGIAPDLIAWVLGWGGEVEVLDPLSLREKVRKTGQEIAGKNF